MTSLLLSSYILIMSHLMTHNILLVSSLLFTYRQVCVFTCGYWYFESSPEIDRKSTGNAYLPAYPLDCRCVGILLRLFLFCQSEGDLGLTSLNVGWFVSSFHSASVSKLVAEIKLLKHSLVVQHWRHFDVPNELSTRQFLPYTLKILF